MFENKCVIITGAGSGLGRELSRVFIEKGATVIGMGRTIETLKETDEQLASSKFRAIAVDVSDFMALKQSIDALLEEFGKIDFVYNNAAVYPKINFLAESAEAFQQALTINIAGVANMCKAVLPSMIGNKFGRIFNIGSWAHLGPISESAVYSCTKGAVHSLTKGITADLAHLDVDVSVHEWIPGHLNTQMSGFTGMDPALAAQWGLELATKIPQRGKLALFEQNWEWQPPKGLKQKILDKLLFRK